MFSKKILKNTPEYPAVIATYFFSQIYLFLFSDFIVDMEQAMTKSTSKTTFEN